MIRPRASIIITNHNYGRYLRPAIDSALAQSVEGTVEVIVVDDGSTDDSRDVIAGYGNRVIPVLKDNGGQASAFNAGFARCRGDLVLLLDADDLLLDGAIAASAGALEDERVSKAHWPLRVIDRNGQTDNRLHPNSTLPDGDYLDALPRQGPWMCEGPPTSGNAWSRRMLDEVFPIPEEDWRICADAYLLAAAPLYGELRRIDRPQSCYRLHDRNNYWNQPFAEAVLRGMKIYERQSRAASDLLRRRGVAHDMRNWYEHSWWHRLHDAVHDIEAIVPPDAAFILADEDQWGTPDVIARRRRLAYPQSDGHFAGPPASDTEAVAALDQLCALHPDYMVFGWPAFWYLDYYVGLRDHLESRSVCVFTNARVRVFDLRGSQ